MLRLHWTTFSLRPYHVLKIQERGEDGVKMKQFRISKFPLRPYYVPATSLLRPHHVLHVSTTSSIRAHQVHPVSTTSLLRPHKDQAVHTTRELRFQHVLTVNILISRVLRVRQVAKQLEIAIRKWRADNISDGIRMKLKNASMLNSASSRS